jgi:hypothetical protein
MVFPVFSLTASANEIDTTTFTETYVDDAGDVIGLEYGVNGEDFFAFVYVNGVLKQKAYVYPESDEIVYEDYSTVSFATQSFSQQTTPNITIFAYSDFVTDFPDEQITEQPIGIQPLSWNSAGWTFYGSWQPSPILVSY